MSTYCELCGKEVKGEGFKVVCIDNATLRICIFCYEKIRRDKSVSTVKPMTLEKTFVKVSGVATGGSKGRIGEEYEVVEDYAKRIREAREKLGWSQNALANRLRVSESIVKRIESGRLKPGLELARRIEKVLGIKLIEPVVDEMVEYASGRVDDGLTIGDLVKFKKEKK